MADVLENAVYGEVEEVQFIKRKQNSISNS